MYRVYSIHGLLLDRFDDLGSAMAAFQRWADAAFVICNGEIVADLSKTRKG